MSVCNLDALRERRVLRPDAAASGMMPLGCLFRGHDDAGQQRKACSSGRAFIATSRCVAKAGPDDGAGSAALWRELQGLKRPKGWRKPIGHRTTWLDARRSADAYWEKWLAAASLRPDLQRLAIREVSRLRSAPKHAAGKASG